MGKMKWKAIDKNMNALKMPGDICLSITQIYICDKSNKRLLRDVALVPCFTIKQGVTNPLRRAAIPDWL